MTGKNPTDDSPDPPTSRDLLYQQLAVDLLNAGVRTPVAEFVADVRAHAGFRASPRQIATVTQELSRTGQAVTVEAVARVLGELRGYSSARQRRHAEQWLALGAALASRGLDGTPSGQRAFIGRARSIAGRQASDSMLLSIALTLATARRALDVETVGAIGRRLGPQANEMPSDEIEALTLVALREVNRERAQSGTPKSRSSSGSRRRAAKKPPGPNFNTRKWRPGGRRRRGKIVLHPPEHFE